MKLNRIYRQQILPVNIEKAWEFFSNPGNLANITPASMDFRVMNELPDRMYAGMIIIYKIRPVAGIPVSWVTEITHVREPYYFVDEQRSGPYKFWHHEHTFEEKDNGVLMTDQVHYSVGCGFIGGIVNKLFIEKQLKKIFDYREKVLSNFRFESR
jgi:ligand-binding SRPBCC domain-containing protein